MAPTSSISTRTATLPEEMLNELRVGPGAKSLSNAVLAMAIKEAEGDRPLLTIPLLARKELVTLAVKPDAREVLRAVLGTRGTATTDSEGSAISRLAYTAWAMAKGGTGLIADVSEIEFPKLGSREFYPNQTRFIRATVNAVRDQKVAPLESATGSGKSLIIAAAAHILAKEGKTVLVASPTHRVSGQTHDEFLAIDKENGGLIPSVTIRGQKEFVSEIRLTEFLESLEADGPLPPECEQNATRWMFAQAGAADPWRADFLEEACPEVPIGDLVLRGDEAEDDAGMAAYDRQFSMAAVSRVIFATHSMLAHDMRRRMITTKDNKCVRKETETWIQFWTRDAHSRFAAEESGTGILPNYNVLLVDEAHDLERQFANAETGGVSVYMLARNIARINDELGGLTNMALEVERCYRSLKLLGDANERLDFTLSDAHRGGDAAIAAQALKTLAATASAVVGKVGKKRARKPHLVRAIESVKRDHAVLSEMIRKQEASTLTVALAVTFSPKRDYPSLQVGPKSVRRQLTMLWERLCLHGGGALLSATLYTPTFSGEASPDHIVNGLLKLRKDLQVLEHSPGDLRFLPRWVFSPVVLHRVPVSFGGLEKHPWNRATTADDDAVERWASAIAAFGLKSILPQAEGGTLILCTSYAAVAAMAKALSPVSGRIIESSRKTSFESLVKRYQEMAQAKERPIWIATGRAWTGLNLRGPETLPPAEDDYLTDLMIPTLPFWLNRSTTHLHRAEGEGGFVAETREMVLMLRQGLGRAVRREHLGRRNIWLMDPRAADSSKAYHRWVAGALREYELNPPVDIRPPK